ncbi:alpha/beta fold hydrolase [Methylophaga sp. OBS4]|uniref:alpha/beta fold hydrolase n=1 Tax=Methylophaga sp. OBS4 TaxID=2991935 RepID=UPI00225812C7|nr:alpha/beta hydrolase [Methylophaga sp. OBS4]MCX4187235.1 alpha/beta hydrolase [Methylophaga sp. OBS4]
MHTMPTLALIFLLSLTTTVFASDFPPIPGKRYDIGGYRVHMNCVGDGQPTVIIDTGLGDDSSDWVAVQQQASLQNQTCVYDRPGYGWSDIGPQPRSSMRIAYELEQLLEAAHIPPPYILVGHSFGGYNIRLYASLHPDKVAGMVLVDASHEQQYNRLHINLPTRFTRKNNIMILPQSAGSGPMSKSPILKERANNAARAEISSLHQSSLQVSRHSGLPVIPLIVISRGQAEWHGHADAENREKIWIELQQDLWKLSPISQHIFAHDSGHDIHLEQPEVVVNAISDVVQLSRVMN